jgi:hypothetical protein
MVYVLAVNKLNDYKMIDEIKKPTKIDLKP